MGTAGAAVPWLSMLLITLVVAAAFGWLTRRLRVPGGMLVGAMVGAAAVTLITGRTTTPPMPFMIVAFSSVGLMTGVLITRERLRYLRPLALPAVGSAILLIAFGALLSLALRPLGLSPTVAALAASPGALSVLASVALEQGEGVAEIMLFHVVRVVMVVLLVPLVLLARPRDAS